MMVSLLRRFQGLLVLVGTSVCVFLFSIHKNPERSMTNVSFKGIESTGAYPSTFRGEKRNQSDDNHDVPPDQQMGHVGTTGEVDSRLHGRTDVGNTGATGESDIVQRRHCDEECRRFRELLDTWPPGKPKAAIYVLTKGNRMNQFVTMLSTLDMYFNNRYQYPIIVFHENEYVHKRNEVRNSTRSMVFFQEISFSIPHFLVKPVRLHIPCVSSISYRHMCRFHAKGVFEEPIVQNLQYYWRLDDDSLLLEDVPYDVFKYMDTNQLLYGYLWRHVDAYDCVEGLWEATERYIESNNLTTYSFTSWKKPWLYYNNFEISAIFPWLSDGYTEYINYIDQLGGIYYHRWGDAPIRGIAVAMFVQTKHVHYFDDISYQHGSFIHKKS